ncbi:MAG: HIT family protein [Thermoprotei archaeon]|nr:MAG: HIT family protein [Thermoprotei archaeon]RLE99968.1 MAG: HIT family protein [Thermoprotei archaeon]
MECAFCNIVRGLEEAYIVYEDDCVIAFLDKYPVTRGHTLVTPKEHFETILEVPDSVLCRTISVVKRIVSVQFEYLKADGVRVLQNNGSAAGQVIFHLHFHVIPYYYGVPLRHVRTPITREEGESISKVLREALEKD